MSRDTRAQLFAEAFEDFRKFCGLLHIVDKNKQRRLFVLNRIQRLYCAERSSRDVVLKPRQVGFTTLELARDAWTFLSKPGSSVTIVVQSLSDHAPLRMVSTVLERMFESCRKAGLELPFDTETRSEWTLPKRDAQLRIIEAGASEAAASKKGRAGTISRLHLTETAFYEYAEETLNALLECVPKVSSGSEIVSESTPNGVGGVFHEQCLTARDGSSGFKLHFFPWWLQDEYGEPLDEGESVEPSSEKERNFVEAGVKPEQLKWYRQKIATKGPALVDQEYARDPHTCFLASGRGFFDRERVSAMLGAAAKSPPIERTQVTFEGASAELRIWHQPEPGKAYVLSADPSEGLGMLPDDRHPDGRRKHKGKSHDPAAAGVWERGTGRHMATLWGYLRPHVLARAIAGLGVRYNQALIVVERNNHGHTTLRALVAEQKYPRIFHDKDERPGWNSTPPSRTAMLDNLEAALRDGNWRSADVDLLGEMLSFVVNDDGRAEAQNLCHDDLVIMAGLGWDTLSKNAAPIETRQTVLSPF